MNTSLKEQVRQYWEMKPCGSGDVTLLEEGSREFFDAIEKNRFSGDDFMFDVVRFDQWSGKKVLEVGCGMGTDLLQFARHGAQVYAVDLTEKGVDLTKRRLKIYGLSGTIVVGDAEKVVFEDNLFDLVYSWGVIHHTPNTNVAARELIRVCKPGGRILAMVYHRYSLLVLQAWFYYGLLRGKPFRTGASIIAEYLESPGTKIFSRKEASDLFKGLDQLQIRTVVTRYDLRIGRRFFLPSWVRKIIPSRFGWFMVVSGVKR
ncbi:MAG: class I SAM-dependent methyltransferase [Chlamydiae bacterium]|nr:class I SAM-dependent methyltransferase [Chlamydiota bacterium]